MLSKLLEKLRSSNVTNKYNFLIVAISGKAGAGKDTFGNSLIKSLDSCCIKTTQYAFADHLKESASFVFGVPVKSFYDRDKKEAKIDSLGISPRKLMTSFSDLVQKIDPLIFTNKIEREISALVPSSSRSWNHVIVITDVRLPHEFEMLKRYNAVFVKVERPDVSTVESVAHLTETYIDTVPESEWFFKVHNTGTISDLSLSADLLSNTISEAFMQNKASR